MAGNYTYRLVLEEQNKTYHLDLCPSQLKQVRLFPRTSEISARSQPACMHHNFKFMWADEHMGPTAEGSRPVSVPDMSIQHLDARSNSRLYSPGLVTQGEQCGVAGGMAGGGIQSGANLQGRVQSDN